MIAGSSRMPGLIRTNPAMATEVLKRREQNAGEAPKGSSYVRHEQANHLRLYE